MVSLPAVVIVSIVIELITVSTASDLRSRYWSNKLKIISRPRRASGWQPFSPAQSATIPVTEAVFAFVFGRGIRYQLALIDPSALVLRLL